MANSHPGSRQWETGYGVNWNENRAEMPQNIISLCFWSPNKVKHKSSIIYFILILCRESLKTRNLGILLKPAVAGFDLYRVLNDYGYSYAVITRTASS